MNKKYIAPSVEIIDIPEEDIIATSPEIKAGVGEGSHVADSKHIDFSDDESIFDF